MRKLVYCTLATIASLLIFATMFPKVTFRGEVQTGPLVVILLYCCIPFIFAYFLARPKKP